jgi:hypothetical protein
MMVKNPFSLTHDGSWQVCLTFMVCAEVSPSRLLASCCSVDVVKGAGRFRVTICVTLRHQSCYRSDHAAG